MSTGTPFLAIDFGTSTSKMAWFDPRTGSAEILLSEGDTKIPSVVHYGRDGVLVGAAAERLLADEGDDPEVAAGFVAHIKRELGRPLYLALPGDRRLGPVEVAAAILARLKRDAEDGHFHETVTRAVLTHPAAFDSEKALRAAAEQAGFREVTLLEEPVAAALAFARNKGLKVGPAAGDQRLLGRHAGFSLMSAGCRSGRGSAIGC